MGWAQTSLAARGHDFDNQEMAALGRGHFVGAGFHSPLRRVTQGAEGLVTRGTGTAVVKEILNGPMQRKTRAVGRVSWTDQVLLASMKIG